MDDRRTPMEAEVQELSAQLEIGLSEDSYGTSTRPQPRRRHTGLWVALGLTVIVLCTASVVAALGHIRVVHKDDGWALSMHTPEETASTETPVRDLHADTENRYQPNATHAETNLRLKLEQADGDALLPEQIYQQTASAVVCVQLDSYYGSSVQTGVVISSDGYILSASDGLTNTASISVHFPDGTVCAARRIGEDLSTGVCLLKAEAKGLKTVRFSDAGTLNVGQTTYCICNPYGSQIPNVFYEGMLCACQTVTVNGEALTLLQTSALLSNVGWGCPILNSHAQVVGLTAPVGRRVLAGADTPCFAVSADALARILLSLERSEAEAGLWLGFEVETIPEKDRFFYSFPGSLWISDVAVGAVPYGILFEFDVITEVDGVPVSTPAEYQQILAAHSPGDTVRLTIFRNGEWYTITLPVEAR